MGVPVTNFEPIDSIIGETDQTDKKLETAVVERESSTETQLDLSIESLSKMNIF